MQRRVAISLMCMNLNIITQYPSYQNTEVPIDPQLTVWRVGLGVPYRMHIIIDDKKLKMKQMEMIFC